MDITFTNEITVEDYNYLRKAVGWSELEEKLATNSIKNALFIVAAVFEGKTIGMARVSGDGGYIIFIADVIVLPDYQNKGIGKQLMTRAMSYIKEVFLEEGQLVFVNLMSAKGREPFYEKFGFEKRPNEKYGSGMTQWIRKE